LLVSVAAALAPLCVFRSILWPLAFAVVIVILIQGVLQTADARSGVHRILKQSGAFTRYPEHGDGRKCTDVPRRENAYELC
jgi:hypothetical protein